MSVLAVANAADPDTGATPTTVNAVLLRNIVAPIAAGDRPYRDAHQASLITATAAADAFSSEARSRRPARGGRARTSKYGPTTTSARVCAESRSIRATTGTRCAAVRSATPRNGSTRLTTSRKANWLRSPDVGDVVPSRNTSSGRTRLIGLRRVASMNPA